MRTITKRSGAQEVLEAFLDDEQYRCLKKHGYFFAITRDRRVFYLDDGKRVLSMVDGRFSVQYNVWGSLYRNGNSLPRSESLLSLLLWLRTDWRTLVGCGCTTHIYGQMWVPGCPPMKGTQAV